MLARSVLVVAIALSVVTSVTRDAVAGNADDVTGHWVGAIDSPVGTLEIDVDLRRDDGAWRGDISIPAQNARDLELVDVKIEGASVGFRIAGVPGNPTFSGSLTEDGRRIEGEFVQGGMTMPFTLERGETAADAARAALADFGAFLEEAREAWNVPGLAVAVVAGGETVFAEGFGVRDVDAEGPVSSRTLFAIGSCTKAFTTFAMATLAEEGVLDWDAPVIDAMPGFRLHDAHATTHVTPRDLVTHRTGLPRHDLSWYNSPLSRGELLGRLRHLESSKGLRETFQYNNLMFTAAGALVGHLTGGTWEAAVRDRIFDPLGMSSSNFSVDSSATSDDVARPHTETDGNVHRIPFRNIDAIGPAGSINSNLDDMARWLRAQLGDGPEGFIQPSSLNEMHAPHMAIATFPTDPTGGPVSYGLGWMVDSYRGHYRAQHGGGIDGFTALVTVFPRDGLGIVAFANLTGTGLPAAATSHAADRVIGLEARDWNAEGLVQRAAVQTALEAGREKKGAFRHDGTTPAHPLDAYVGTYEHPGYGRMVVARGDDDPSGQLEITYNGITTPFEHWHYETFRGVKSDDDPTFDQFMLRFDTGLTGRVVALRAPMEPAIDEIVFERRADERFASPDYLRAFVGRYQVAGQTLSFVLGDDGLRVELPGQPPLKLVPVEDATFTLDEVEGVTIRFVTGDDGARTALLDQRGVVMEAVRMDDAEDDG